MRNRLLRGGLAACAALALIVCAAGLNGCASHNTATAVANTTPTTPYGAASKAGYDTAAVIGTAIQETDSFRINGVISVAEERSIMGYLEAANTATKSYGNCVEAAHAANSTSAGFVACAVSFASDASSSQTLASVRVVDPKTQAQVQAWAKTIADSITAVMNSLNNFKAAGQ